MFKKYLEKKYRPETVIQYAREIKKYLTYQPNAEQASYSEVLDYISFLRKEKCSSSKLQGVLLSIKQYYFYLLEKGKRKDHPCRYITLKDKPAKDIQLQDLFTEKELELLLERKERYKIMETRNKVLLSLLIYQGLTTGEIINLKIKDIHLDEGIIHVQGTTHTQSRTIGLKTKQIMLLHEYIKETYPKLLTRNKKNKKQNPSNPALILTWQGSAENGEGISYLISTYKKNFLGRNLNPKTIRQSVITNLLKQGKDLRIVQEYIGHKSPDTTEKYKQSKVEELQAEINKYHPLR